MIFIVIKTITQYYRSSMSGRCAKTSVEGIY